LTAPDTYFMYYLTPFIAGYAVAAAAVLYAVLKRKLKSESITDTLLDMANYCIMTVIEIENQNKQGGANNE